MFDLKAINAALANLQEERGIPRDDIIEAIEASLATAYKKEYGKRGQIVRCQFNFETGEVDYEQAKTVVDDTLVKVVEGDEEDVPEELDEDGEPIDGRARYNPEQHMFIQDARFLKKDVELEEEIIFPLESKADFGRIAAQTAKQVIIQKIRESEKDSVMREYGEKEGEVVSGTIQRVDRGNVFIDLGRAVGVMPRDEQIPGERFKQGERVRAYLYKVDEGNRGAFLRLSRSHPHFVQELFASEAPEIASGVVEIKSIAREPGSRTKIAVFSHDDHVDPVGAMVGQRGVRVNTVTSELGGEKVDIIEWSEDVDFFVEEALSPAEVIHVEINEDDRTAKVEVAEDQQSLAIGRGGQNVRLAAKLTGWKIDIVASETASVFDAEDDEEYEELGDFVAPEPSDVAPEDADASDDDTPEVEETDSAEVVVEGAPEETEEKE